MTSSLKKGYEMLLSELRKDIKNGLYDAVIMSKCGISNDNINEYKNRILKLADDFKKLYEAPNTLFLRDITEK